LANFGKRIDGPSGRRWLKRKRVGVSAIAVFDDWSTPVLVQDLAMTGAKLLGRDLPANATKLSLSVGERSLRCEIRWAVGDYRGVSFDFARRHRAR
jgi:hypothetical protein